MADELSRFHKFITDGYDLGELRTLCFSLSVDYASLPGEGKAAKSRELLLYAARQRRLAELLTTVSCERPEGFDFDLAPVAVEALYEQLPAFEADSAPHIQQANGHHISQAAQDGTAVVGDGNVMGDGQR
jgi:hypothetical protein